MRRYPPFDPPEHAGFQPDPEVMAEYRAVLARDPERRRVTEQLRPADLLRLYEGMVRFRLHDITLKRWVRQGIISKAWLGTGEEAVTVGSVRALRRGDLVGPMIRNAGACHEMGMPVAQMLKAYLGTADQITRGRDLHTGDLALGVVTPTSMMGCLVPVFTGIGIALKQRGEPRVGLTYVGDGASRTTAFHEGFNFASVMKVPVIIVLQDNQVALGTPKEKHSAAPMEDLHLAYGVPGESCEGNNVLDVYAATHLLAERCRSGGGPVILTARTFRMGGHATHDEAEARALFSPEQFRYWGLRDPIGTFEAYLMEDGPALDARAAPGSRRQANRSDAATRGDAAARRDANRRILEEAEARVTAEVEAAEQEALESRHSRMPAPEDAVLGVYAGETAAAPGTAVADEESTPAEKRRPGGDGDGRARPRLRKTTRRAAGKGAGRTAGKGGRRVPPRPRRRVS
jgi:TPP-dependent pyruvate/acetoin dehydrogenase alpha subunit